MHQYQIVRFVVAIVFVIVLSLHPLHQYGIISEKVENLLRIYEIPVIKALDNINIDRWMTLEVSSNCHWWQLKSAILFALFFIHIFPLYPSIGVSCVCLPLSLGASGLLLPKNKKIYAKYRWHLNCSAYYCLHPPFLYRLYFLFQVIGFNIVDNYIVGL